MLSVLQTETNAQGTVYSLTDASSGGWLEMKAAGSNVTQVIDTNVATFGLDASGAAVALEDTGNLVLFPANSPSREVMLSGVRSFVIDISGVVTALAAPGATFDSVYWFKPGSTEPNPYSGVFTDLRVERGAAVAARNDYALVEFPDSSSPPPAVMATDVRSFVVDQSGSMVALSGSELLRWSPGSDMPSVINGSYTALALDGKGDSVALDNSNALWLLPPGSDKAQPMAPGVSVITFLVDSSGSVIAFEPIPNTTSGPLVRFAAGSTTPQPLYEPDGSDTLQAQQFLLDGSGSLVALDASHDLVRFAPGATTAQLMASNITGFVVDGAGFVVAQTANSASSSSRTGSIARIGIPGTTIQQLSPGSLYVPTGSGNLIQFAPGSDSSQNIESDVKTFAVDGGGGVVTLNTGDVLTRFAPGATTSMQLDTNAVLSFMLDTTGQVVALEANGDLVLFDPTSAARFDQRQVMIAATQWSDGSWNAVSSFHIDPHGVIIAVIAHLSSPFLLEHPTLEGSTPYVIAWCFAATNAELHYFTFNFEHLSGPGNPVNLPLLTAVSQVYLLADGSMAVTIKDTWDTNFPSWLVVPQTGLFEMFLVPQSSAGTVLVDEDIQAFMPPGNPQTGYFLTGVSVTTGPTQPGNPWDYSEPTAASEFGTSYTYTEPSVQQPQPSPFLGFLEVGLFFVGGLVLGPIVGLVADPILGLVGDLVGDAADALGISAEAADVLAGVVDQAVANAVDQGLNIAVNGGSFNWTQFFGAGLSALDGADLVGSLVGSVDPVDDSIVANVLDGGLNKAVGGFLKGLADGGTLNSALGQAAQGALDGLTRGVGDALENSEIGSTFLQEASSFLSQVSDASADLPFVNSAVLGFFNAAVSGNWSNLSFASLADSGASLLEQIASDNLSNTPFASDAVSLLSKAVSGQITSSAFGNTFAQDALSFFDNSVADQLTGSDLAGNIASFVNQISQTGLGTFVSTGLGQGLGTFLQQAVSGGLTTSPLAEGVGALLQQVAGTTSLDTSEIANGVGDLLLQAGGADSSIESSPLAVGVGELLQQAKADGLDLVNSPLVAGVGKYLQQYPFSATDSGFSNGLGSFLQQAVQDGPAFMSSAFATSVGKFLQQGSAESALLSDPTIASEIGTFLQQAAKSGTLFSKSTLSADVGSFLTQAASDGQQFLNSGFMGDAASFLAVASADTNSLQATATMPTLLGTFLRLVSQDTSYPRSGVGTNAAAFLQQSEVIDTDFLEPNFVNGLESLLPSPIAVTISSEPSANTFVGAPFSTTVHVADALGHALGGIPVTLTLRVNSGNGALNGTLTETSDSNGDATFNNLSMNEGGVGYVLTASDATSNTATSSPFDISVQDWIYTTSSGSVGVSAADGLLAGGAASRHGNVAAGTVTGAQGGSFTFNADGSFTYTPAVSFLGFDSAPFNMTDPSGDKATQTVTVLSQHAGVVWKFYESVLNRTPDPAGLQYWTNYFNNGGKIGDMAFGFFESDELLDKVLGNYYEQYLLRPLDANGLTYWKGVWHATGGPEQIKAGFADSPEFFSSAGGTPQSWIAALYQRILNRTPDPNGESFWMNYYQQQTAAGVDAGTVRYNIALGFFDSPESFGQDVAGWFQEYLFRAPTAAEQAQYVSQMKAGATDRTIEQEITNLPEYANNPSAPAAGTGTPLADYYPTPAQTQAVVAAKDALFARL
ncbi:MAG TPA: DUF4214 domain-containing protein [Pirellulales bacterium]|nr:DUF4214 domain-containing protein [Pirellulales bacterium]